MRVVIVAEQLRQAAPGGIGTYIRGLTGGLRALEPQPGGVVLWASRSPGRGPDPVAAAGAGWAQVAASRLPSTLLVAAWDRGLVRPPTGAEVVHATSLAVPPRGGSAMTTMVHDLAWRRFPDTFPARGRRWHEAALRRAIRRSSMLLAPSAATAGDLVAAGVPARSIEVIEEGCDHLPPPDRDAASQLLKGLGVDTSYLLTVSTIEPRKNLERLVAAYTRARPRLPGGLPLVVVGPSGWGSAPTLAGDGVIATGAVEAPVLAALYAGALLMAYVPLWEGFGLPALEAMTAGTPVLSSPIPSTGGATYEVDPSDIEAIATGLERLATDSALRTELVAAGRQRSATLTWAAAARQHMELWHSLQ